MAYDAFTASNCTRNIKDLLDIGYFSPTARAFKHRYQYFECNYEVNASISHLFIMLITHQLCINSCARLLIAVQIC